MLSDTQAASTTMPSNRPTGAAVADVPDATLLALVLSGGRHGNDRAAMSLTDRFGDLGSILNAETVELRRAGVAPDVIAQLERLRLLFVRAARAEASRRPVISSWNQLLVYVRTALAYQPREQFRVLFLDKRNVLMVDEIQATGTIDHAPVYPREVVRRALELNASSMILAHNHPSGDPAPSTADIAMTRKVIDAARVFDILVHDHVIVGRRGTASFKSLGLI